MPPVPKVATLPDHIRGQLRDLIRQHGGGNLVEITRIINGEIRESGLNVKLSKSGVHRYAQLVQEQAEALETFGEMVASTNIEGEADVHRGIAHLLSTEVIELIMRSRESDDEPLGAKDIAGLASAVKSIMGSSINREKLLAGERDRIRAEERERAANSASDAAEQAGISAERAADLRRSILGVG